MIRQAEVLRDVFMRDSPLTLQQPRRVAIEMFGDSAQISEIVEYSSPPIAATSSSNANLPSDKQKNTDALTAMLKEGRDTGYKAGHLQGVQDGYQEGMRQAQEHAENELAEALKKLQYEQQEIMNDRLSKLDGLIQGMPKRWDQFLTSSEDEMVALAFDALCRILGKKMVTQEDVRLQVLHVLSSWRGRVALEIHIHPDELQWLLEDAGFTAQLKSLGHDKLRWVGDGRVDLGGCLLRSSEGGLDARLEVQLQRLRATLLAVREQRRLGEGGET